MNDESMDKSSETDWEALDAMSDEDIDFSDIPPLGDEFFARASLVVPCNSVPVTLPVAADVLKWFQAHGQDWQRRMNAALRLYAEAHRSSGQSAA